MSGLDGQDRDARRARRTVLIDGRAAIDGEVLVRFRESPDDFEATRAADSVETDEVEPIGRRGARRLRSRRLGTRQMLEALRANPDVEYAEPNYLLGIATLPNDPFMINLWGLFNAGQTIFGTPGITGADSGAHNAWDLATGSRANVVAIIDTGIDYNHPDLAANIWSAPRAFSVVVGGIPITCPAGSHGFNAITNSCNPMDDNAHGTHVAGTIGAVGMNGVGVVGVNWVASMMGLKFLSADGSGSTSDAIKAIEFAIQAKAALGADANVRILNNSWGGGGYSVALANQIQAANTANMLFVASAGNGGADGIGDNNDLLPSYPASYTNANVMSVAASTNRDQRSYFSNFGPASVDLAAPGSAIRSTVPNGGYAYYDGTSMATPHVSGAAALLLSACALDTTAALKSALMTSVDPIAAFSGLTVTGGRLNVNTAIRACPPLAKPVPVVTSLSPLNWYAGQQLSLTVNGRDFTPSSVVRIDGVQLGTMWMSSTQLTAMVLASDLPATGPRSISVFTPGPGGGTSGNLTLNITAPASLSVNGTSAPITVGQGTPLTIGITRGPASNIDWVTIVPVGSASNASTGVWFLNGTATPPATGVASAAFSVPAPSTEGTYEVRFLFNGRYQRLATSAAITVVSVRPAPQLTSISPVALVQGGPSSEVIVTGSGFHATSQVLFDGAPRTTVFNSSSSLTVTLLSSDLQNIAAHTISVTTPAPGGGTSATAPFNVIAMPAVPRLTSVSPTSVAAGLASAQVTVTGSEFAPTSRVVIDTATVPTTFVSSTTLTATIPGSSIATPGSRSIFVLTPAPGGGSSESVPLTVIGPTMTVNGSAGVVSVAPGAAMTIAVANGPGNVYDWITIAPVGSSSTTYTGSWFLNGSSTPPSVGITNATVVIPAPATEGGFEVRFLASGRYQRLATSTFVVERQNPAPVLSAIAPASVAAGTNGLSLVVTGSGFTASSQVRFDGSARTTTFNHAGMLTATLTAGDLAAAAAHAITVLTPAPGGGTSSSTTFTVIPPPPAPVLASISPASVGAGAAFVLTASGSSFVAGSQILIDGAARPTTFVSSTQLTATIPASDVPGAGARNITVFTPAPGGGTSAARVLSITGPLIAVNGRDGAVTVGAGAAMAIDVANGPANIYDWVTVVPVGSASNAYTGIWFLNGLSTPPASGKSSATIVVPAPATAGTYEVRFLASGGYTRLATSAAITVAELRPAPHMASISPTALVQSSPATEVIVTGSGFHATSQVLFDGAPRPTVFNSSNSLTVTLPSTDLLTVAAHTITVNTPGPGGGTSAGVIFNVFAMPVSPQLTSVSPATAAAGLASVQVTVTGSDFAPTSRVVFDTATVPTTFVSSTSLMATIPGSSITTPGSHLIFVLTPAPGGGASASVPFTVTGPAMTVNGNSGIVSVAPGAAMTIAIANGPGNVYDWITIAPVGSSSTTYMGSWFMNGSSIPPSVGITNATVIIPAPATEGGFEVRFLASGRYQRLATSTIVVERQNPAPVLSAIAPTAVAAGTNGLSLAVGGSGFTAGSQVHFDGTPRTTTFNHAGMLTATLTAGDLATAAAHVISVVTPAPGGGTSSTATFTVIPPPPSPVLASISPTSVGAGAAFVLTASGSSFVGSSQILIDGVARPTTFVSSTQLTATIPASDVAGAGSRNITVFTPAPGGGTSASRVLSITGPAITVNGSSGAVTVAPGAALTVAIANGPANVFDWVTIAPVGSSANTNTGVWFLNGTSTPPASGVSNVTLVVPAPTAQGSYEVRFLASGGYGRLATSGVITVVPPTPPPTPPLPPPGSPAITVNGNASAISVSAGAALTIAVANGPAHMYDWVTIAPVGSSATTYTGIWFLNGLSTPPASGVSSATIVVPAPVTAGTYEVRFLGSGGYTRLATSGVVTVTP